MQFSYRLFNTGVKGMQLPKLLTLVRLKWSFIVTFIYYDLNMRYPNLKTIQVRAELDFHSFDTPLDSIASKLRKAYKAHIHIKIKSYL